MPQQHAEEPNSQAPTHLAELLGKIIQETVQDPQSKVTQAVRKLDEDIVIVPDQSTIILGGMLKLNQSRGGKKVPILGDVPLVGVLFRGVSNTGVESKLYIFVRAQIIRSAQADATDDLARVSREQRKAYEAHELQFQEHQGLPGVKPKPTQPAKVLDEE